MIDGSASKVDLQTQLQQLASDCASLSPVEVAVALVMMASRMDAKAAREAGFCASLSSKPDAYVPIHPVHGPLWSNVVVSLDADRPAHYPLLPLFVGSTQIANPQLS